MCLFKATFLEKIFIKNTPFSSSGSVRAENKTIFLSFSCAQTQPYNHQPYIDPKQGDILKDGHVTRKVTEMAS